MLTAVRWLPHRYWLIALAVTIAAAGLVGLPTAIIPNPFFTRMLPTEPYQYGFWIATSLLLGLIVATYFVPVGPGGGHGEQRVAGGGLLSVLAVGCPICNKLVVLALGVSGALTYFAPLQPLLGVASVALLVYTLRLRWQQLTGSCLVR